MGQGLEWYLPRLIAGVMFLVAAFSLYSIVSNAAFGAPGFDFRLYATATERWLSGGAFYEPHQLYGLYITTTEPMYPPVIVLLVAPFTVLPAMLWWLPMAIVTWRVLALRPSAWGRAGIAACLAWPTTLHLVYTGNPAMWACAALALATRWPWVSVFVFLKPSVFPFAFFGIRHRSWWVALAICLLIAVPFGAMWLDWFAAITNARGNFSGPLYSIRDFPLMLIPVVAYGSSTRNQSTRIIGVEAPSPP